MMYSSELNAIKKSNRFRKREVCNTNLIDFASNDYLGLSEVKSLLLKTCKTMQSYGTHAPKSSQLVNGYHQIHKNFEELLCKSNGFSSALVLGSGFLANLALIESLPRKKDLLILDEEYHASGLFASKLLDATVWKFQHNNMDELEKLLNKGDFKRVIVAVEGIYSMSGNLLDKRVFELCDKYKFLLIVDEAHSVGVVGEKLLGVFDLYDIKPNKYHIKMGTLGKALGSYGAYILCSNHISEYLQNRAKPLIYTTAPSLFDTELAKENFIYMRDNREFFAREIKKRKAIIKRYFGYDMDGLIFSYKLKLSQDVLRYREELASAGFSVGAIRPPTVEIPILRIIPRVSVGEKKFEEFCKYLVELK